MGLGTNRRKMHQAGARLFAIASFLVLASNLPARASILDGKYGGGQVFDCQRSPAFPVGGSSFTASNFRRPYADVGGQYDLACGEYIGFFYVGGTCSNGAVGINRYDASDTVIETISASGTLWGLDNVGFLYVSGSGFGTFITNGLGYAYGDSVTYTPAVGQVNACGSLDGFAASAIPICGVPVSTPTAAGTPTPTATPVPPPPCQSAPRGDCASPGKSLLKLQGSATAAKQRLYWRWQRGTADASDFGDPIGGGTTYHLCVYDDGALVMSPAIDPGGTCSGKPCWKDSTRGLRYLKYSNKTGNAEGIRQVKFKAGAGKAQVSVSGKGAGLTLPFPITDTTAVTVQLVKDTASGTECWGGAFPAPAQFNKPVAMKFRDKTKAN